MMRARLIIAALLSGAWVAHANPASLSAESMIAFCFIAFCALAMESSAAMLVVALNGVAAIPVFGTLLVLNLLLFSFGFLPLLGRVPLLLLELAVVAVDAAVIKLVVAIPGFQTSAFIGVSWKRALIASLIGNAFSYFIGVLASGSPGREPVSGAD